MSTVMCLYHGVYLFIYLLSATHDCPKMGDRQECLSRRNFAMKKIRSVSGSQGYCLVFHFQFMDRNFALKKDSG